MKNQTKYTSKVKRRDRRNPVKVVKGLNTFFEEKQLSGTEKASTWFNEKKFR